MSLLLYTVLSKSGLARMWGVTLLDVEFFSLCLSQGTSGLAWRRMLLCKLLDGKFADLPLLQPTHSNGAAVSLTMRLILYSFYFTSVHLLHLVKRLWWRGALLDWLDC